MFEEMGFEHSGVMSNEWERGYEGAVCLCLFCWVVVWLERLLGWELPLLQLSFTSSPNCPPAVNLTKHGGVCWWSAVGTRSAMWCQADENSLAQHGPSGYFLFCFPFGEGLSGVPYIHSFKMRLAKKNGASSCCRKQVWVSASIFETASDFAIWTKSVNMHNIG